MIIGFLGKGGSGKTTMSTLFTKFLSENKKKVLAIDNDHNMDFKFNLGFQDEMNYIGRGLEDIFQEISIQSSNDISKFETEYFFSLSPQDKITEKYSVKLEDDLFLMSAGPATDDIIYGDKCSHVLTSPIKIYLPLLDLKENEFVIVDEKAGLDGVGTGITTGFNLAVVVAEATLHGVKTAKQIINFLKFYKTPFVIFLNKIRQDQDLEILKNEFLNDENVLHIYKNKEEIEKRLFYFYLDLKNIDLEMTESNKLEFKKFLKLLKEVSDDRKLRTKERIEKSENYKKSKKL